MIGDDCQQLLQDERILITAKAIRTLERHIGFNVIHALEVYWIGKFTIKDFLGVLANSDSLLSSRECQRQPTRHHRSRLAIIPLQSEGIKASKHWSSLHNSIDHCWSVISHGKSCWSALDKGSPRLMLNGVWDHDDAMKSSWLSWDFHTRLSDFVWYKQPWTLVAALLSTRDI